MDAAFEIMMERLEAKYLVSPQQVPAIREYIKPFCEQDKNSRRSLDGYVITTLQLDTPNFALHMAKPDNALTRFKLRVRTYGLDGKAPVFLEVKRKFRGSVIKTRAAVPPDRWGPDLLRQTATDLTFRSTTETAAFCEFLRLARETGARPAVRIRYHRESFFGLADRYSRLTLDSRLRFQRADDWSVLGGSAWHALDSNASQGKGHAYSGVVLELKALVEPPQWMMGLVEFFELERVGHCKYSMAVQQEAWDLGVIEDRKDWVWGL